MLTIDSYAISESSKGEISLKIKVLGFDTKEQAVDALDDLARRMLEASGQETLK